MQWPLLLGTWGYHLPGCKDPYIPAPGVTSASNSGPFVAGRARIDPCSAPPPVTGVKVSPVPSLGESNVTGPTRSVWSTTQPQGPVRGLLVAHYVVHQSNARFGWAWGPHGFLGSDFPLPGVALTSQVEPIATPCSVHLHRLDHEGTGVKAGDTGMARAR